MAEPVDLALLLDRVRNRPGAAFRMEGPAPAGTVVAIAQDSREVGPGTIFGAVRGHRADGHDYVDSAVEQGAIAVIAEEVRTSAVPTLVTEDPRALIGVVAAALHGDPSAGLDLVGVTGTNGKTSVVTLLEHVVDASGHRARSVGTLTNTLTTSAAPEFQAMLARARADGVDVVAAEVSSHALDQRRVDGSRFRLVLFTNLSQDHLDYHGDLETYFAAKARLFTSDLAAAGIVDVSTPAGRRLADEADIPVIEIDSSAVDGLERTATGYRFGWRGHTVELPLPGRFNVANALLVAEASRELGIGEHAVVYALATAPPVPGRFEPVDAGQPFSVVVDYSHTPASLEAAIAAAREVAAGAVIVVFGAAGDRDPGKRPLMGAAASAADRLYVTSDNPRSEDPERILDAVESGIVNVNSERIADRRQAISAAIASAEAGDLVLIAGKGHEDYQIVGDQILDFDDRTVAREALADLGWVTAA